MQTSTVPEGTASSVKEPMDRREEASRKATGPPVRRMVTLRQATRENIEAESPR
ncbi:hypothetical protein [Halalkalibacter sp. APA_J-10(15)]|uniref:hypothetical protein n=1 Tax=Halalkalibacter sp. APA_J-10(15) TaxID=2933805 RepID=UPI001FF63765|nr:hypothetical protein [Halalkalibacter sp. APA_J-10(15)]MCK0473286.1 hypothetical protein [Halalkalibacter sp. APA_J-10(15)]